MAAESLERVNAPAARLAVREDDLASIACDVGELVEELARLREDGVALARLLQERDAALEGAEAERLRIEQRADELAEALRLADARLHELNEHVEAVVAEREALRRVSEDLALALEQERAASARAVDVAEQWQRRADDLQEQLAAARAEPDTRRVAGHVRFVAGPGGYRLTTSDERCPEMGELLSVDGCELQVVRKGRSPLPGDVRPCVFLQPPRA